MVLSTLLLKPRQTLSIPPFPLFLFVFGQSPSFLTNFRSADHVRFELGQRRHRRRCCRRRRASSFFLQSQPPFTPSSSHGRGQFSPVLPPSSKLLARFNRRLNQITRQPLYILLFRSHPSSPLLPFLTPSPSYRPFLRASSASYPASLSASSFGVWSGGSKILVHSHSHSPRIATKRSDLFAQLPQRPSFRSSDVAS